MAELSPNPSTNDPHEDHGTGYRFGTTGHTERRLLTALCYDLVGSTALLSLLGEDEYQELLDRFQTKIREAIAQQGGVVISEAGDGGVVMFPTTMDAKDAAALAITTGFHIVESCKQVSQDVYHRDLAVRVAIASSPGLLSGKKEGTETITALALALATRLQSLAEPNSVLVSDLTRKLAGRSHAFQYLGRHDLKGFSEPQPVWKANHHRLEFDRFLAFGKVAIPFLGREEPLRRILNSWEEAKNGRGSIVLIEGEAGIGKSRLLREVLRCTRKECLKRQLLQCAPNGRQLPLHPLLRWLVPSDIAEGKPTFESIKAILDRNGIQEPSVVSILSAVTEADIGQEGTYHLSSYEERQRKLLDSIDAMVKALTSEGPIIIAIEDVQWIDATSRSVLAHLIEIIERFPLLLILTCRTGERGDVKIPSKVKVVHLRPLDRDQSTAMLRCLSTPDQFEALAIHLDNFLRVTGGIPLLLEEIIKWGLEDPRISADRLSNILTTTGDVALQTLLDTRLASLGQAREVAQVASILGDPINMTLIGKLLPTLSLSELEVWITRLLEAEIFASERSEASSTISFRHALIRESIYKLLPRRERKRLHAAAFQALRQESSQVLAPLNSLAFHAENAGLYEECVLANIQAAKQAARNWSLGEARSQLEKALEVLERVKNSEFREQQELSALSSLGPVLTSTEGPASSQSRAVYERAIALARRRPLEDRASLFPIYWGWWFTGPEIDNHRALAILEELKDVPDEQVQLQVRHCLWAVEFYVGRHIACIDAVNDGLLHYQHEHGLEAASLYGGHDARVCGLMHRGLAQWLRGDAESAAASISAGNSWAASLSHVGSIAHALHNQAIFHCFRRDFPELSGTASELSSFASQNGMPSLAAASQIFRGWILGNQGELSAGVTEVEAGLSSIRALQTQEDLLLYTGMLCELLGHLGQVGRALELLDEAKTAAEANGHHYWMAELYRRRAILLRAAGRPAWKIEKSLSKALRISTRQGARTLSANAYATLVALLPNTDLVHHWSDVLTRDGSTALQMNKLFVSRETFTQTTAAT